jgi:hypothetical protein
MVNENQCDSRTIRLMPNRVQTEDSFFQYGQSEEWSFYNIDPNVLTLTIPTKVRKLIVLLSELRSLGNYN